LFAHASDLFANPKSILTKLRASLLLALVVGSLPQNSVAKQ
jgi:hypothetical protein